jgi:hypothetical protein
MHRFVAILISLSLLLGLQQPAHAQGQAFAELYPPDLSTFPQVSALVDVFDETGRFATGLTKEAITIIENGQPKPADELIEQALPAQLVVGINPGPALDVRDGQGISRFERIYQVVDGWAQTLSTDMPDDLSLVSISGPIISHANPTELRNSLRAFAPDFRNSTPNLQALSLALDLASMQTPRQGMKKAVLFITPHMDDPDIAAKMQPLIDKAAANKVRVFVWFVDLEPYFVTTSAAAFSTLTVQTGGSLFAFSGKEAFPNPEAYFAPLRRTYTLKYTSAIQTSGEHSLGLEVTLPGGKVSSAPMTFSLDLQPPNPIPVSPPLQITRQAPEEDPFNTKVLLPEEQAIKIIIEYPDGHQRPLARTTLYVDGQIADENTSEPFDTFTWDLRGYSLSGEHQIMVEAVDTTGLSKTSLAIPVAVTVIQPPRGLTALFARYSIPLTVGAVGLAGLALVFVLLTGRLRIPGIKARRLRRQTEQDPLTQPVISASEIPTKPAERVKRKREAAVVDRAKVVEAPALLVRLLPDGQPSTENPIPLSEKEMVFGMDPVECNHVLDDPSIGTVHARLKRTNDGEFMLHDSGSVAGTWVNYDPIGREGRQLKSGDMVHFGQLIYRFQLKNAPPVPEPKIVPEKIAE